MSFFFDVWASEGFVLASDVRIIENGKKRLGHKLVKPVSNSNVNCAIAVCGDYPDISANIFREASSIKDTLKEISKYFAIKWTKRFAGTNDYSAVHLVGFEKDIESEKVVPQMWYWYNWKGPQPFDFRSQAELEAELSTFCEKIPRNNHIPYKIKEICGKFPEPNLNDEADLVNSFLRIHQPFFTWNGDNIFWRSALDAVGAAMNLLSHQKSNWSIADVSKLTTDCIIFLSQISSLLRESTVGLSPNLEADVLEITSTGINVVNWTNLD